MKRIAVIGERNSGVATLIGDTLRKTAGWRVGVLPLTKSDRLEEGFSRLERAGYDCAVGTTEHAMLRRPVALGVLTGGGEAVDRSTLNTCEKLVVNLDGEQGAQLANRCPVLTYSERNNRADLIAKFLRCYPNRTEFDALTRQGIQRVRLPVLGGYDLYQGLAALGCGLSLGFPLPKLAKAVECAAGLPGKMEPFSTGLNFRLVLDTGKTAEELEPVLLSLSPMRGAGGRLCVLLGQLSEQAQRDAEELAGQLAQEVLPFTADRRQAVYCLLSHGRENDVLLIAGAHEAGSAQDERKFAAEWLREHGNKAEGEPSAEGEKGRKK